MYVRGHHNFTFNLFNGSSLSTRLQALKINDSISMLTDITIVIMSVTSPGSLMLMKLIQHCYTGGVKLMELHNSQ